MSLSVLFPCSVSISQSCIYSLVVCPSLFHVCSPLLLIFFLFIFRAWACKGARTYGNSFIHSFKELFFFLWTNCLFDNLHILQNSWNFVGPPVAVKTRELYTCISSFLNPRTCQYYAIVRASLIGNRNIRCFTLLSTSSRRTIESTWNLIRWV